MSFVALPRRPSEKRPTSMATPGLPNQNHHVNDRCQRRSQKRRVDDVITRDGLTFLTNRCVCIPLSVLHPNIDQKMLYSTEICWGFAKQKDCLLRQVHGKTVGDHAQPKLQISDNSHNPKRMFPSTYRSNAPHFLRNSIGTCGHLHRCIAHNCQQNCFSCKSPISEHRNTSENVY